MALDAPDARHQANYQNKWNDMAADLLMLGFSILIIIVSIERSLTFEHSIQINYIISV